MLRRMGDSSIPGERRKGRQKTRWKDSCKSVGLKADDELDKREGRYSTNITVTPDDGKSTRRR